MIIDFDLYFKEQNNELNEPGKTGINWEQFTEYFETQLQTEEEEYDVVGDDDDDDSCCFSSDDKISSTTSTTTSSHIIVRPENILHLVVSCYDPPAPIHIIQRLITTQPLLLFKERTRCSSLYDSMNILHYAVLFNKDLSVDVLKVLIRESIDRGIQYNKYDMNSNDLFMETDCENAIPLAYAQRIDIANELIYCNINTINVALWYMLKPNRHADCFYDVLEFIIQRGYQYELLTNEPILPYRATITKQVDNSDICSSFAVLQNMSNVSCSSKLKTKDDDDGKEGVDDDDDNSNDNDCDNTLEALVLECIFSSSNSSSCYKNDWRKVTLLAKALYSRCQHNKRICDYPMLHCLIGLGQTVETLWFVLECFTPLIKESKERVLFEVDMCGRTALHVAITSNILDNDHRRDIIEFLLSQNVDHVCKNLAMISDENNVLPLHLAAQNHIKYADGLKAIMTSNKRAIGLLDDTTQLYPF